MALSVTLNGTNVTVADATTGWSSATITAPELWEVEVFHQGGGSIGFQASSKDGYGAFTYGGTAFDFTASGNAEGQHIFYWVNITMPGTVEALATGGLYLIAGSSSTNYKKFLIAAKDYKEVMEKGFARFVLDPTKTATETVGTPDMTAVTFFGVWIDTDEAARIDQLFIDRIDVAHGITVSGTSSDFWNDLALGDVGLNAGVRDNMFGVCQKYNDTFYLYGQVKIEQGAAANTVVSDSGKTIKFVSQQYYNGTAWVDMVADGFFKIELVDNASYATQFTDGVAVGTAGGRSGSSIAGSLLHDTLFDASAMTHVSSFAKLYATQLSNMRSGVVLHSNANSLFYGGAVIASGQMVPGIAKLRNMIIAETSDLDAALLWNDSIDIQLCQFIANSLGAAVEHPGSAGSPYGYSDLVFTGNTYDGLNTAGADIIVNNTGASNAALDEGANTITYNSAAPVTITVKDSETDALIQSANVRLMKDSDKSIIMNEGTNASGVASETFTGSTPVDVVGWVRQMDLSGIDYVQQDISGQITSSGFTLTVKLKPI